MLKTPEIKLTVNELVATLSLSGYEYIANQIIQDHGLINSEEQFNRFVQETETSLKKKGYWDDNQETGIARGLQDLLYLLVHSKKKIRAINMRNQNVIIIHLLANKKDTLIQFIDNSGHHFYFQDVIDSIGELLRKHAEMDDVGASVGGWQPLHLSDELFNEFHATHPSVLQFMTEDRAQPKPIREFVSALLANGQEFNNISYMQSNYIQDHSLFEDIHFFIPAKNNDYIWHLDYQEIESAKRVILQPIPVNSYFQEIERVARAYFTER